MAGHSIVILAGAAVAIVAAVTVVFGVLEGPSLAEKALEVVTKLAFVAAMAGWLLMWFTQQEIWSPAIGNVLLSQRFW
jgi:hypothetical protein